MIYEYSCAHLILLPKPFMPEHTVPELKEDAKILAAVGVCRFCFLTRGLDNKPTMPFASEALCSIKSCENGTAYLVALSPYDFKH